MDDDEVLLTKFILCGGYLWDAGSTNYPSWFAIEPGCTERSACHNSRGVTPTEAVLKFIESFGEPWEKNYKSFASTSIADGLTPPPTA